MGYFGDEPTRLTATARLCHDCATADLRDEVKRLREVAVNLTTERNESWDREHEQRKLMREAAKMLHYVWCEDGAVPEEALDRCGSLSGELRAAGEEE